MSIYQNKRGTAARWIELNPVLADGEIGVETDNTSKFKIGDGNQTWLQLPYAGAPSGGTTGATGPKGATGSSDGLTLQYHLDLTYSGFLPPVLYTISDSVIPFTGGTGTGTLMEYNNLSGLFIDNISIVSSGTPVGITFNNLVGVKTGFAIQQLDSLLLISCPILFSGPVNITNCNNLSSIYFPQLTYSDISLGNLGTTGIDFPSFTSGSIDINSVPITTLDLESFTYGGGFNILNTPTLNSISFPLLTEALVNFVLTDCSSLTSVSMPSFITSGADITILNIPATSFNFSSLTNIGGSLNLDSLQITDMSSFASVQNIVNSIILNNMQPSFTTLSMPNLKLLSGGGINANASDTYIDSILLPSIVRYISGLVISAPAVLATVQIGTIGTLKEVDTGINIQGVALSQMSVDDILAILVSLDGTNGTTLFGPGETVNLSGGTSSAPSVTGQADAATLISRGATVITN